MNISLIIEILGLCLTGVGLFLKVRKSRLILVLSGIVVTICGFILENNWVAAALCVLLGSYVLVNYFKNHKKFREVRIIEVPLDDIYLNEFLRYYAKSLYNYFPFFELSPNHKAFLLIREMNVAGILLAIQEEDVLTIEIDFLKPEYRDFSVGNYIYNKNTGYFKRMGINTLKAKSYHYLHSKYLLKMGFKQTFIDGQLFFIKPID